MYILMAIEPGSPRPPGSVFWIFTKNIRLVKIPAWDF